MAVLQGYSSYSQYALKTEMAKSPKNVQNFYEELVNLIYDKAMKELQ